MSECLDENTALELIEGALASARRARVERHLEACDACRELVVELAKDGAESGPELDDEPVPTERLPEIPADLSRAGPYRIEREVGSGAAGTVYRAVDERNGHVVALKYVTDPAWRARFAREAETLARLEHPGIVRYAEHGETRQGLYLAMEWLEGEDLASCLDRGPLPWPAVRVLGLRLAAALAHAHTLDAVHRDIKPCNIFLPSGKVEQAKLLDFGLVRVRDSLSLERTASQAVLGTPQYMAPEQVKDPRSVDARSDLFSLGVVFFEALSGVRPFDAEDLFTVWLKIVDQPAPDLRALAPDVPEAFVVLIERLLAKDPAGRPTSAAVVHEALVRLDVSGVKEEGTVSTAVERPLQPRVMAPLLPPMPVAVAITAPPQYPSGSLQPHLIEPTPKRNIALVAVSIGALLVGLLGAGIAVLALQLPRRQALAVESSSDTKTAPIVAAAPLDPENPVSAASTEPPSLEGYSEHLVCTGEKTDHRKGGVYAPPPENPDVAAISIVGKCKAVLEDCTVGGKRSLEVVGQGELTLRHCQVAGATHIVGDAVLILDGTKLPSEPVITGKARVLYR